MLFGSCVFAAYMFVITSDDDDDDDECGAKETQIPGENLPQCHFIRRKAHII
jgi:hypothetical protein